MLDQVLVLENFGDVVSCLEMGQNARKVFEKKYTAERNFELLLKIYQKVMIKRIH